MKKILMFIFGFIVFIVLPVLIGSGVAEILLQIYENYSRHWFAGAIVCFLTGAVGIWFPILFLIEDLWSFENEQLRVAVLVGGAGGFVAPLIIGFNNLGLILISILILTTLVTVTSIQKIMKDTARQLEELRKEERGS